MPTHEAGKTGKSGENGLERDSQKEGRRDLVTATLAANVMTVLIPYAAIGAQEFAKSVGKSAYEKAKSLLGALKEARQMGAVETTGNLARFEEKPERYRPVLNDALKQISTSLTAPELDGIGSK